VGQSPQKNTALPRESQGTAFIKGGMLVEKKSQPGHYYEPLS